MGTTHGHIYVEGSWAGWASYIQEPFGHTLRALVCFLQADVSRRWDGYEMQVTIQAGAKKYLQCSNIKKTGGTTVGGQVWSEYLISYESEENVPEAASSPFIGSSENPPQ
ncbi:MAG: hypothetical protein HY315_08710 [Acidobacteria bacterium]|nr:hypothetical protein [Acidobacteriota bacterium]